MSSKYPDDLKNELVRLHLYEKRTITSLAKEYNVPRSSIYVWVKIFSEGRSQDTEKIMESINSVEPLYKELNDLRKENEFLKKAVAYFAQRIEL